MATTVRPQQRYDHRLRELVHPTGDVTIATDLGVPRSTARGSLRSAPHAVLASLTVGDVRLRRDRTVSYSQDGARDLCCLPNVA